MLGTRVEADRHSPYLPIHQFEPRSTTHVLALSSLEGLNTHFYGRTRACPGPSVCRVCQRGGRSRYYGFFAAIVDRRKVLVRLTSQAALRLVAYPPQPGTQYRAVTTSIKRPVALSVVNSVDVPADQVVSQSELIQIVMGIFGLGLPAGSTRPDDLRKLAFERAKSLIDAECLDLL